MLQITYEDLGTIAYKTAWDYQENLMEKNLEVKKNNRQNEINPQENYAHANTHSYLLFCEHPHVYTLGKSGHMENLLVNSEYLKEKGIEFFKTNRGGDITYHGPKQIVGYPILDLELLKPDIVWYMRSLEEVIIKTLGEYGIHAGRSEGETGVWLDAEIPHKARKICAMGVKTSRWITMHGFALNVNTDLSFFDLIIPCGIQNKQVTSIQKELNREISLEEVKQKLLINFNAIFNTIIA